MVQLNDMERFNVTSMEFAPALRLSSARQDVLAVATDERVAFVGGRDTLGTASDAIDVFDPRTGKLSTATLAEARGFAAGGAIGERLFIGGGTRGTSTSRLTYERIDLDDATPAGQVEYSDSRALSYSAGARAGDLMVWTGGYVRDQSEVTSTREWFV